MHTIRSLSHANLLLVPGTEVGVESKAGNTAKSVVARKGIQSESIEEAAKVVIESVFIEARQTRRARHNSRLSFLTAKLTFHIIQICLKATKSKTAISYGHFG